MNSPESDSSSLRDILTDAFRYWERRRLYYNLVLVLVVAGMVLLGWPESARLLGFTPILSLFILAVLANICYSAAYLVDIPIQFSAYRDQRHRWRTALWVIGTVFAAALAYFWMTALISAINF